MPIFWTTSAGETLKRQSAFPLMRGIRMQLHWHDNEMYRFAPVPDLMNDARFRKNLALLADYGWSFDLQVFASQMKDAAKLAADNPDITFILQHAGMLEDLTPAGRAAWRDGMKRLADQQNVVSKLSALGTFIHRNDQSHIADVVSETIEIFGADRCLFGSNYPIEKLWTSYADLVGSLSLRDVTVQRRDARRRVLRQRQARLPAVGQQAQSSWRSAASLASRPCTSLRKCTEPSRFAHAVT